MNRLQKGFTLMELMIVVAIIGILAGVAIPAYQDYIARSQVSEAVSLAASGKVPLSEYWADKGVWPDTASDVMGTTAGRYVSALTITSGNSSSGASMILSARMKGADVSSQVRARTLELETSDGGKSWVCTGGDIASKFRPASCRV